MKMLAKIISMSLLLALLATLNPVIATSNETTISQKTYNIINSTCASTLYPHLCIASLITSSSPPNITTTLDVVMASLNHTIATIQFNKFIINKIAGNASLAAREKAALQDCNKTADESVYELEKVRISLKNYTTNSYSSSSAADDLLTLLSAAMTNQETCIDGFSQDQASRVLQSGFLAKQLHAYRLCSNILAMVKNMTDSSQEDEIEDQIESNHAEHEWPQWSSSGNRRLLQSTTIVTPDATFAADVALDGKEAFIGAGEGPLSETNMK